MALQPAAGAKDLNPRQVETNRQLTERLASVYRLWGYDEVSPPRVERLATLMAGGAIDSSDIVRLVADDPPRAAPGDDGIHRQSRLHPICRSPETAASLGLWHGVSHPFRR